MTLAARAHAHLSEAALHGNLTHLSRRAATPLLLPVKANAYGHGLREIVTLAARHPDVWGFAVATPREAAQVAALHTGRPTLLLTPPTPAEVPVLADLGVRLPVASLAEADALPAHARAHLKVDTGMNRLGARPEEAIRVGARLAERGLLEGAYTHFATADEPDLSFAYDQLRRFRTVLDALPATSQPLLAHAANGGGILSFGALPGMRLARPGLTSYGFAPPHLRAALPLRPVMTLTAQVTHLHTAHAGETVSYGGLWRAPHDTRVATVGIGYADGYPRGATGRAHVLIAGQRRPVLGRICMDQLMVDATGLDVQLGDPVTLWTDHDLTVTDVAAWGDTIEYEVLTGLGERVDRVVGSGE
ncbi:alanine racemase, alr [Deinococcus grandis]|uniref:Alanine racemase n=1 Tax=Deinococcus grandis TaxID=57498 RepID=A0A100HIJ7_9DEIO|nr:alanine racemase [Deinococcus grandis]BBN95096.1 alanine racemase [Deinococcus grandis]GAQ21408.1 alanine racemase, alr [Deinococcus grandis]